MEKLSNAKESRKNLILFVHSLSVFLISFYLLYFISGLSVLYIAWDFDIPATLFINSIHFNVPDNSPLWSTDAIISILMATPVSSFITGILVIFIFLVISRKNQALLFFCLWIFLQAFNTTFGLLSENILSQTGLVRVAREMGIKSMMLVITVGMSFFFMYKSGQFAGKLFFAHQPGINTLSSAKKFTKALVFFLFPWLAGSIIIMFVTNQSLKSQDFILSGFMLILLIPAIFTKTPIHLTPVSEYTGLRWSLPIVALITTVSSLILLRGGFSF